MCENVIEMEVLETLLMYACGSRNPIAEVCISRLTQGRQQRAATTRTECPSWGRFRKASRCRSEIDWSALKSNQSPPIFGVGLCNDLTADELIQLFLQFQVTSESLLREITAAISQRRTNNEHGSHKHRQRSRAELRPIVDSVSLLTVNIEQSRGRKRSQIKIDFAHKSPALNIGNWFEWASLNDLARGAERRPCGWAHLAQRSAQFGMQIYGIVIGAD